MNPEFKIGATGFLAGALVMVLVYGWVSDNRIESIQTQLAASSQGVSHGKGQGVTGNSQTASTSVLSPAESSIDSDATASVSSTDTGSNSGSEQAGSVQPKATTERPTHRPGIILFKFKPGTAASKQDALMSSWGFKRVGEISQIGVKIIEVPLKAEEQVRAALAHNPNVEFAEFDQYVESTIAPNDPCYTAVGCPIAISQSSSQKYYLQKISLEAGWDISMGSPSVSVAILDSGINPHPDLTNTAPGFNFVNNTPVTTYDGFCTHGMGVAGTSGANANNGVGTLGIAPKTTTVPLVIALYDATTNINCFGAWSAIAAATTYAADHGIRIINNSYGGTGYSSTLQNAINYAWSRGSIFFASAGNEATSTLTYPAAMQNVVGVAATTATDAHRSTSNYGSWIDVSAPGTVLSTDNVGALGYNATDYVTVSGTSFASPLTAGLAALVLSVNPALTNIQVVDLIKNNSDDLGDPGFDQYFGWGRINVLKTLQAASGAVPTDTSLPQASIIAPANGAQVQGLVSVQVTASDNTGVVKVELWKDGILFATTNTAPFNFNWDSTLTVDGNHSLQARAYDAAGNVGSSGTIVVSAVNGIDGTAPAVSIATPANQSEVKGITPITVTASDAIGVTFVEIWKDGLLFATLTQVPYTTNWDTTLETGGSHTLMAKAYDAAGNIGSTASRAVTVNNTVDTEVPTVVIKTPTNGAAVTNKPLSISVGASDNIGVVRIEILVDGVLKATCLNVGSCTYSAASNKITKGSHTITARAVDAVGLVGEASISVKK